VLGLLASGRAASSAEPGGRLRWWHGIQFEAVHVKKDGPKVRTILVSSTLFLTVVSSVGLGVVSAYAAIQGILQAFAQRPRPQEEPSTALLGQEATVQQ